MQLCDMTDGHRLAGEVGVEHYAPVECTRPTDPEHRGTCNRLHSAKEAADSHRRMSQWPGCRPTRVHRGRHALNPVSRPVCHRRPAAIDIRARRCLHESPPHPNLSHSSFPVGGDQGGRSRWRPAYPMAEKCWSPPTRLLKYYILSQGVWRRHLRNHGTRQTQPKKPVPTARVHPSGNRLEQHPTVVGAVAVERQVVLGRLVVDQVVHEEVGRLAPGDDLARVGVHGGGGGLGAHPRTMDATCRPENQLIIILAKKPRRAFATVKKQRKKPLTRGLGPVFLMVLYDCSVELGPALSSSTRRG